MRLKTTLTTSLLLLAVGATPALAQEPRIDGSDEIARAIARDTGLSDAEVKALLPAQERAIAIDAELQKAIGEQYGGAYFDAKLGKLVVNVTDKAAAEQVQAAGAEPRLQQNNLKQLGIALHALEGGGVPGDKRELLKSESKFVGLAIDPISNTVSVTATKAQLRASSDLLAKYGDLVSVEVVDEAPEATAYMDGGDGINGNSCSAGFNLRNPSTGARYLLTAGHCVNAGSTLRGQGNVAFGTVLESWFPTYDDAIARYNGLGAWTQGPWVDTNPSNGGVVITQGWTDAPVGTIVCKSGVNTKWTCGWITKKNENVTYSNGDKVYGMTRHNACVQPGDSGGANVSYIGGKFRAEGVTSGASMRKDVYGKKRCLSYFGEQNKSWYFPIADSLAYYGPKYGVTTW